jgi:hypothetical protein
MNRWIKTSLIAAALAATSAYSQGIVREAPKDVKPGIMAVSATPPVISMDGQPARLSPGARVRDVNNMMVLSGALANKTVHTVYRRDPMGLVHEVWILTPEEYAKLGGTGAGGDQDGYKRFYELLNLIWTARSLMMLK